MKITDFTILFICIVFSFVCIYEIKDNMEFAKIVHIEEVNRMIDNTTVYALEKGYKENKDGKNIIDCNIVVDSFITETCKMFWGISNELNKNKLWDRIVCMIIVKENSYFLCKKERISNEIVFEGTNHESKVKTIESVIENFVKEYGYKVYFPKNFGENNSQTISENMFLVIYKVNCNEYFGEDYSECIISAAAIKS